MTASATWYRYTNVPYVAELYENGFRHNSVGETPLLIHRYSVVKVTPKGVWLAGATIAKGRRFVLRHARKQFACPTKAQALESFLARKGHHANLLRAQLETVTDSIAAARELLAAESTEVAA